VTTASAASSGEGPGTILNVNDDEQQRDVVSQILREVGYRVLEAATGLEAVAVAGREQPDVVVLDIQLPDINGMEVCRRLKQNLNSTSPFVLHTSATFASTEIRVAGLDVGGDAFLAQPFTAQELVATVRALIRRKRVEEDQRRRAEEFAEADRRKDDFLAMLGHELRNPLNALAMAHAVIEQYPAQSPAEQHARGVARRQTAHLTRLVNDLLEVSRVTRGKITLAKSSLDLADVVRETAGVIRSTTIESRSQTLVLSLPDYSVPVDGDRVRLGQIFANLLENASKYSPDHSQIDVELDVEPGDGLPVAAVTIVDRGKGIAQEQLGHVFSLFYQAQPSEARIGTGLGIGLTLVRALAELHGGSVTVRSAGLGKGSEFKVRLPTRPDLVVAGSHDLRQSVSEQRRLARKGRIILIVEDNADARDLLGTLCRTWGFDVALASNGLLGVEKARTLRPHLALVDIGLPGIDGYEVARRLRGAPETEQLTLVALTGYGLPAQRERALAAGFDVHLVKPVDPELLSRLLDQPLNTIARLRDRRRSLQPTEVERRARPPM
jgi:two-component system, sensor histidine kinase